jgi:hypothetical protein
MNRILSSIAFLVFCHVAGAQTVGYFVTDLKGEPILNNYSRVTEGSPFFSHEWLKGRAVGMDGKVYENLTAKLNLLEPGIHFQDEQQREFRMNIPMRELVLSDPASGTSYRFLRSGELCQGNTQAWYQVLDSGRVTLLKLDTRLLTEVKPYGSAVTEEHITASVRFFLLLDGRCRQVRSPAEAWTILSEARPGFTEKPSGKTNAKKLEGELARLTASFNKG